MEVVYVDAAKIHVLQQQQPPSVMALGYFDGVHLGHQQVIQAAKIVAQQQNLLLSILSFFPHPKSVLGNQATVHYLEPLEERIQKLASLGVDVYYVVKFDYAFSQIEADVFIKEYVLGLGAQHIVCGFDYKYGQKAKGNRETLRAYEQNGIGITIVEEERQSGHKISSSIIRECVQAGHVEEIPKFLGEHYSTKYCLQNGTAEYYMLPPVGKYKANVVTDYQTVIEANILVDTNKRLHFENTRLKHTQPLKIFWLEKIE
jgi:riboflavin kinase/FMN adenylyltransferase